MKCSHKFGLGSHSLGCIKKSVVSRSRAALGLPVLERCGLLRVGPEEGMEVIRVVSVRFSKHTHINTLEKPGRNDPAGAFPYLSLEAF